MNIDDADKLSTYAAGHAIAQMTIDRMASYLQRGRQFAQLLDDELKRQYLQTFREWSKTTTADRANILDDMVAELGLRNLSPPNEEIAGELKDLLKRAKAAVHARGPDLDFGRNVISNFLADLKRRQ